MIRKSPISQKDSEDILKEMCSRVGADYDSFDFKQPQWFTKHAWTQEQQDDFHVWVGKFLTKKGYTKKGRKCRDQDHGMYEASKLILNYGWRVKPEKKEPG